MLEFLSALVVCLRVLVDEPEVKFLQDRGPQEAKACIAATLLVVRNIEELAPY